MAESKMPHNPDQSEQTFIKGLGFCGNAVDGNVTQVDVKDGKIVRIHPFHYDWKYRPDEFRPWKIEAHGRTLEPPLKTLVPAISLSYKKRVYSPNRVLYPLRRVDFDPAGDRHIENRGKSGYIRISWDEALDTIVNEIKRMIKIFGPYSILSQSDGHGETKTIHAAHGCGQRLLNLLGGFTLQTRNPDSWEGWYWGAKHTWGMEPVGQMWPSSNLVPDIAENTQLLLHWGCDMETTPNGWSGQFASRLAYWFTDLGIKSIFICPDLNYSAAIHADKWIPIFPNTDAALQLAVAYTWITESTFDHEYILTHAVGFEIFRDYVLGVKDGLPKTPKWAAGNCGVPSRIIKALARDWAKKRTTIAHNCGGSMIRGPYSTEPARLEVLLLAMQGLGRPGSHQFNLCVWGSFARQQEYSLPYGEVTPNLHPVYRGSSWFDRSKQIIAKDLLPEAILNPPVSWYAAPHINGKTQDQFNKYTYPAPGCSEIHMIWSDAPCWLNCWNDGNRFIQAMRSPKIEFVLTQHPWLENDCLLADIILPVSTKFEEEDINADCENGQFQSIYLENKCIQPLGESKSDYEIVCLIAERFGLLKEYTEGKNLDQWIRTGFESSGVAGYISYEKLKENGYYVVPTSLDWQKREAGMLGFYQAPDQHPLQTPSGKIEFFSQALADHFPDDKERPPVPAWVPFGETHQESRLCERVKAYPLLLVSNHPRWRVHVQHDDITWLREIPTCKVKGPDGYYYEPVWMHSSDAEKRGIRDGDVVKLFNERGGVLGGAVISERIIPGAVYQDHGARYDPIIPGELDRGGANNTIAPSKTTSKNCTGMATSGFLVEVERVDLNELRIKYPAAFNRSRHPAVGQFVGSFVL